jgi:hypothetical protein
MTSKNKLLTILSDAEQFALYGLPDFDDGQRPEYLSLCEAELALVGSRPSLHAQVQVHTDAQRPAISGLKPNSVGSILGINPREQCK